MKKKVIFLILILCTIPVVSSSQESSDQQKKTRNLVIYDIPTDSLKNTQHAAAMRSIYDGIVELLSDKGYRVVDRQAAEAFSMQIAETHNIDPVLNKAAQYGLKFFAENTIYFKFTMILRDEDNQHGALIRTNVQLIDNTSAQILAVKQAEASSAGLSTNDAVEKAGRNVGKKAAYLLLTVLANKSSEAAKHGTTYLVVIESQEEQEILSNFLSFLEKMPAVTYAREIESGGGKSSYEVTFKGRRDQLDREVDRIFRSAGVKITKVRSEGNRSTWIIK